MRYRIERVSQDLETKQHVLVLQEADGMDRLALNIQPREAQALESLLAPQGLPGPQVLDHLRDAASRTKGAQVVGIQLLLSLEGSPQTPALTPMLILREEGSPLEQAVPASLAHAAAWSLSLGLPFEIDEELLSLLQATVTMVPGAVPSAFRDLLGGLEEIDSL